VSTPPPGALPGVAAPGVAVVTGAGSDIGRETALRLAGVGHAVVVNDLLLERAQAVAEEIRGNAGEAMAHVGDVTVDESVADLAEQARHWHGRVDVLVNNAGKADSVTPTVQQAVDDWQHVMDVCLRSAYLCSRQIARDFMLPQRRGRIVNIASIAGVVGLPMRNAYSAAKAGVLMMTRTMACEWAAQGVTVNAVAPGYIRTPMLQALVEAGRVDESMLRRRIPAGDLGNAGDVASAVLFLASDAARYVTGVSLPVDGGWCAFGAAGDASSATGEY
jgi:NAD(P)-dependent dehydrogenase (short-subunit alcohol dehydrogenase family)